VANAAEVGQGREPNCRDAAGRVLNLVAAVSDQGADDEVDRIEVACGERLEEAERDRYEVIGHLSPSRGSSTTTCCRARTCAHRENAGQEQNQPLPERRPTS
jgi:hypothetical protein